MINNFALSSFLFLLLSFTLVNATCEFSNIFLGPRDEVCYKEYLEGRDSTGTTCYRDPDCYGITCRIEKFGVYTLTSRLEPCNVTLNFLVKSGDKIIFGPSSHKVESISIPILGIGSIYLDVIGSDASYVKFNVVFKAGGVDLITLGPFQLGDPNCIYNEIHCQVMWIYIGAGILGLLIILITICLICRSRSRRQKVDSTLLEPLIINN